MPSYLFCAICAILFVSICFGSVMTGCRHLKQEKVAEDGWCLYFGLIEKPKCGVGCQNYWKRRIATRKEERRVAAARSCRPLCRHRLVELSEDADVPADPTLVVVVPVCAKDKCVNGLITTLGQWNTPSRLPCRAPIVNMASQADYAQPPNCMHTDLALLTSQHWPSTVVETATTQLSPFLGKCFEQLLMWESALPPHVDTYLFGINTMFIKAFACARASPQLLARVVVVSSSSSLSSSFPMGGAHALWQVRPLLQLLAHVLDGARRCADPL